MMVRLIRRILIGQPLATDRMEHEKVGPLGGMAVFAADAMSSVAYGPEEVLLVLVQAGSSGLGLSLPIGIALALLMAIVATSYRQTVVEYPSGGGAYIVAHENLGPLPAQIAGGALLTDYVLTVAVSVAAGVAALTSAWPALHEHSVAIATGFVIVIMLVNLRGVRESAAAFALPVYGFAACCLLTIALGLAKLIHGDLAYVAPTHMPTATHALTAFLVLRAFSSGCASLTGIEAVANGVQAFREPRGPNASRVMLWLALILGTTVLGVTYLARHLGIIPLPEVTVMSQIGERVYGRGFLYYALQLTTTMILIFAANTSFSDFPRLSAFMSRDGYMPRQMANLGDRLVFANGIVLLALLAIGLIVGFGGDVTRLIPLYAVGVFTAFTTSQTGMVVHWARKRGQGWLTKAIVNGLGALSTGIVLIVVAATKFALGAWIVCLIIPILVFLFRGIRHHYGYVASRLSLENAPAVRTRRNLTLLLVGGMHRGTLEALQYMKALSTNCRAVHVEAEGHPDPRISRLWTDWEKEIPLVILQSPYRNLAGPLLEYCRQVRQSEGYDTITIVIPEFVVDSVWESILHNHTALWLQVALHAETDVAVANMRYRL
jgi:amino acid transporter